MIIANLTVKGRTWKQGGYGQGEGGGRGGADAANQQPTEVAYGQKYYKWEGWSIRWSRLPMRLLSDQSTESK